MKVRNILTVALILTFQLVAAQQPSIFGKGTPTPQPKTENKTDSKGLKQGDWERYYNNGRLMYSASFKNDTLVGEMVRYHPNGNKMAYIKYDDTPTGKGYGEVYDDNGRLIGKGNYFMSNKEGEWLFYNRNVLVSKENYINNKKEGISYTYYDNSQIAMETNWKNDKKDGVETAYYISGKKRTIINYKENLLHGHYFVFQESGRYEVTGAYSNNKMNGIWVFYNPDGSENYRLNYKDGVAEEEHLIEKQQTEMFERFEENRKNLRDPEEYMNDPDSYMRGF